MNATLLARAQLSQVVLFSFWLMYDQANPFELGSKYADMYIHVNDVSDVVQLYLRLQAHTYMSS